MHTKIYVRLWIYPVVDKLRLRTGACACVQYIMPLQLEHFKGARSLAVRFSRKHFIPIQSSPPNTVGTHGCLAPSTAIVASGNAILSCGRIEPIGAITNHDWKLEALNCHDASPQHKKSSRIRIHDPIQNEWNRWTFRLPNTRYISTFSITSEKPDPPLTVQNNYFKRFQTGRWSLFA